jgi:hypothetical protein
MPPLRRLEPIQLGARTSPVNPYPRNPLGDNPLAVSGGYADAAGNSVPTDGCNPSVAGPKSFDVYQACMRDHGVVNTYTDYQPGSRMDTFHLIEEGIFVAMAAILFVLAWWRVRRATTIG